MGNDAIQESLVRIGGRQRASRSRCGLALVEGRVGGGGGTRDGGDLKLDVVSVAEFGKVRFRFRFFRNRFEFPAISLEQKESATFFFSFFSSTLRCMRLTFNRPFLQKAFYWTQLHGFSCSTIINLILNTRVKEE